MSGETVNNVTGRVVSVNGMTSVLGGVDPQYLHVTVETDLGGDIRSGDRVTVTTGPALPSRDALVESIQSARTFPGFTRVVAEIIADRIIADAGVTR